MELSLHKLMAEIDEQLVLCTCESCEELRVAKARVAALVSDGMIEPLMLERDEQDALMDRAGERVAEQRLLGVVGVPTKVRTRPTRRGHGVRGGRTRAGKARPGRFTEQVVAQLARGPQTAIEVADALGVSPQRTYGPLQRLVALGQARKGGKPITFELIAARDGSMAA